MGNVTNTTDSVRLMFLGGLGEFGMNMMLVECGDDAIIIDAGMMFPDRHMHGVDFVLPDLSAVLARREKLRGVILTHGHEDHIGGLSSLLHEVDIPAYGSDLTLAFASSRLEEYGLLSKADLRKIDADARLDFGCMSCEFFQTAHSVPGVLGVALRTPVGTIVHTSDFKLDHTPIGSDSLDVAKLSAYGNEGVLLLLSDSTNSEVPGYASSERSITDRLDQIFQSARRRLIVSAFASSIYRIQQFIDLAARHNRHVAITGRSMVSNVRVASELGYLWMPSNLAVDVREVKDMAPEEVMILTTGTQGEPLSALSLMATGSHGHLQIEEGDTVIISARLIPGHEKEVTNLINHLYRRGADVYAGRGEGIHVSGHGAREDQKMMLSLTRPRFFIPMHGEYRQLVLHARLARDMGMPAKNVLVVEDGQRVRLTESSCEVEGTEPTGRILVDGRMMEPLEELVLRDRRQLATDGMVMVVVVLDRNSGAVQAGPDMVTRGFIDVDESANLVEEAKAMACGALDALNAEERADQDTVREAIRLALRRLFTKRVDRRPLIIPVILEV